MNEDEVLTDNQDNHVDPEEDGRTSPFADLCVARSTASLWGRRIVAVTTSDSAAFAVSELGEVRTDADTSVVVVVAMLVIVVAGRVSWLPARRRRRRRRR